MSGNCIDECSILKWKVLKPTDILVCLKSVIEGGWIEEVKEAGYV